jgi:peptidoglycan/LPS O-acetylase OafA/YrhL
LSILYRQNSQHTFCFSYVVINPTRAGFFRASTLGKAFDPKNNAFAFMRCVLALLVIVSHSYSLGGFGNDPLASLTSGRQTLGVFAVAMFFVLSGFLITRSALNLPSAGRFLWHRFLRIFPGYWVCLIVSAFVIAPLVFEFEYGSAMEIFSRPDSPQAYVAGNFALLHWNGLSIWGTMNIWPRSIGRIFVNNAYPWVMNGSLWSLPYEWLCYLIIALLTLLGVLRRMRAMLLSIFLLLWAAYGFSWFAPQLFRQTFPCRCLVELIMLSLYFLAGAVCYLYRGRILFSRALFFSACVLLLVGALLGAFGLVAPIVVPYAFLWLACTLPIPRFDARGDFSYGLYIYAFPVQQTLAALGVPDAGFFLYILSSVAVTSLLAILSYRFVEAPCLKLKHIGRSSGRQSNENASPLTAAVLEQSRG